MFNQFYPGFMPNYGQTLNPYNSQPQTPPRVDSVQDQPVISNTIQTIQKTNPAVSCYFVNDKSEMQSLDTMPGTVYIGLNKKSKEVYIRSWNNDGKIDFDTYSRIETGEEMSEMQAIINKLNNIEEKLNERNATNVDTTVYERQNAKQSDDVTSKSNDARKKSTSTVRNVDELREI